VLEAPPAEKFELDGVRPHASRRRGLDVVAALAWLAVGLASPASSRADDTGTAELIDWHYGAVFGTGVYKSGDKKVAVLRLTPAFTVKPVEGDAVGLRLLLPVTLGLSDFDDGKDLPSRVGSVSFLPGLEYLIPVTDATMLKPFVQAGAGSEFSSGNGAMIYAFGAHTRTSWRPERTEWLLGTELTRAGYRTGDGSSSLLRVGVGVGLVRPLDAKLAGHELNWGAHAIYRRYLDDFDELRPEDGKVASQQIRDEVELALSLGTYRPVTFLGFTLERLGLGLTFAQDLVGIKLVTRFPF
jgi:hypothetical protein